MDNKKTYNYIYHLKHREYINKRHKLYRKKHIEDIKQYNKQYKKNYRNTEHGKSVIRAYNRKRMYKLKGLDIIIVQRVYEDNIKKYGTLTCYLCGQSVQFGDDHLEHKIPVSRGGNHLYENLGIACSRCNLSKGNKTEEEYIGRLLEY